LTQRLFFSLLCASLELSFIVLDSLFVGLVRNLANAKAIVGNADEGGEEEGYDDYKGSYQMHIIGSEGAVVGDCSNVAGACIVAEGDDAGIEDEAEEHQDVAVEGFVVLGDDVKDEGDKQSYITD